ncbi:MAG: sugar phosphate nucleotidyltransferase [Nitrospiria bacterium]
MSEHKIVRNSLWGIVLAGGEGKRIDPFVRTRYGLRSPKQYIAFTGKRSMLQHTLHRVEKRIPPERTLIVVNPSHIQDIKAQLYGGSHTIIFQPYNRETAPGVLLPLIHIFKRDPEARIAIFPSDHFIEEEDRFMSYVSLGDEVVQDFPDQIVILGIRPEGPEVEYGWIEPADAVSGYPDGGVKRVRRFFEKPDRQLAQKFFQEGYLWNSFVSIVKAKTLIEMTKACLPHIWGHFERMLAAIGTDRELPVIEEEYRGMEGANLSRTVFEKKARNISVVEVEDVYWSDWGDGERVISTLKRFGKLPLHLLSEDIPVQQAS